MDGSLSQMGMDGSILGTNVDENAPDDQEEPPNVVPGAGQQSDKPLVNHEPLQGLLNRLAQLVADYKLQNHILVACC